MKLAFTSSLLVFAMATPALSAPGSLSDFQLPPEPPPTSAPTVQGPVDLEGPVPIRPRAIRTAQPSPTPTAQPAPIAQPTPAPAAPPSASNRAPARATPIPAQRNPVTPQPATRVTPEPPAARTTTTPTPTPEFDLTSELPASAPTDSPLGSSPSVPVTRSDSEEGSSLWMWLIVGLLGAGIAGFFVWRRRRSSTAAPVVAPAIVRPKVKEGAPAAAPPADAAPLKLDVEVVRVNRSVMNVTLSYRLNITNNTAGPLTDLTVGGDLISAHGALPVEQQLAGPGVTLQRLETIEHIEPGETLVLTGEIRLPVGNIRPLRQGKSPLLVPLLRLRAEGAGLEPVLHTYVVGMKPPQSGARLQPFRLDETPQGYTRIGLRALA